MESRSKTQRLIFAGLLLVPIAVFGRVVFHGFLLYDDFAMVQTNLDLLPSHWPAILSYWYQPHLALFVPLTYSLYAALGALSFYVGGAVDPWWFHATNLLLHLSSGIVLWKLLTRLGGDARAAGIGAGLFLLHPVQVEAVAWISSLNTVLAGFLVICTLRLYVFSLDEILPERRRVFFAGACVTAALAMLAKPSAIGLPLMVLAVHQATVLHDSRRAMVRFIVLCAIVAPLAWVTHRLQASPNLPRIEPLNQRLLVSIDSLGFYLEKLFVPLRLTIDYGRIPSHVAFGLPMLIGFLFLLSGFFAIAPGYLSSRCLWRAGQALFVIGLAPVLGVIPFYFQFYSTVADRYMYLAMIGPALIATDALRRLSRRSGLVTLASFSVAAVLLLACGVLSFVQAGVWKSDVLLCRQALSVNSNSIAGHMILGYIAAQEADQNTADAQRRSQLLGLALNYDQLALDQNPVNARVHYNLANLLLKIGRPAQSIPHYAAAAGGLDRQDEAQIQNNWGVACLQLGKNEEAIEHFGLAAEAAPDFADALANAGTAYLRIGRPDLAREQFSRALSFDPHQPQAAAGLEQMKRPR